MTEQKQDGWNEWAKRVLGDIERIDNKLESIINNVASLRIEIAVLKAKAAMLGVIWGAVVSIIVSVVTAFLLKSIK